MMKHKLVLFTVILSLISGLGTACGTKGAAPQDVQEIPVTMQTVKTERVSGYSLISGLLEPYEESLVSFEAAGRIQELSRKEGDVVQEGDFLGRLEATEYSLQVAQAQNALEKAGIHLQKMKDDHDRIKQLHQQGAVSQSDYETAKSLFQAAQQDYYLAQKAYSLVGPGSAKNVLASPINGTIIAKMASVGQVVGIGNPVYRIGEIDQLKVLLPVPDREIASWKTGVTVTLQIYEERKEGRVTRIFPALNQGTGTISVEVTLPNPRHDWYPGQVVAVKHEVTSKEGIFIPVEAVINQGLEKPYVYLGVSGKAVKTEVTAGMLMDNKLEIVNGLKVGDQVIIKGYDQVFDGSRIKQVGVAQ